MITVEKFLDCVRENAARVTHYESGCCGGYDGGCDCIGLIIGALRLAGEKWDGTHGSNYAARNEIQEPYPYRIKSESELEPGMIVFKAHAPGDSGYDLPSYYDNSPDRNDYYHVGVVMGVGPLDIMHCTKALSLGIDGITEDHSLGKWAYYAKLRDVDYSAVPAAPNMLYKARVVADSGSTVNMRKGPSMNYDIITRINIGDVVDVYGGDAEWQKIYYNGQYGYMMTKFLAPLPDYIHGDDDDGHIHPDYTPEEPVQDNSAATIDEYKEALRQSNEALDRAADALGVLMAQLEANKKLLEE